ncbi:MAG: hypothetical protein M0002_11750 [Rhodospirillales bacterium]|nr:hypothetical protein [Rhodospirillales bacterium]
MQSSPYDFDVVAGPPAPREERKEKPREGGCEKPQAGEATEDTPAG